MSTRNLSYSFFVTIAFFFAIDSYVFYALGRTLKHNKYKKGYLWAYAVLAILSYIGFYYFNVNFTYKPLNISLINNLFAGYFFAFFAFRLVLFSIFIIEDVARIVVWLTKVISNLFGVRQNKTSLPQRRKFIRQAGLTIAAVPFTSLIYGVLKGRYDFRVNKITLSFKNLPKAFDGYKIVQISDIHSGSFDTKTAILEGVEMINNQNPDAIFFTGDLVNNDSNEVLPYIEDFAKLQAKDGVFSVLGNHDYGDYKRWPSQEAKQENRELLYQYQKQMGFELLRNENAVIKRGEEQIAVVGVENWGNKPFPQLGDLDLALKGVEEEPFKVLLSHDPTHWTKKIIPHQAKFDLTLSGHTHGMQFGIEIPGFVKWSPVKYIYPQWAGLYQKAEEYLYVNRGFGFLGYPGRAGIRPEIAVIELKHEA